MPELETLLPHTKDLGGGFLVRRSLPSVQRQAVGPFVFFDHFGPIAAKPEDNFDVRPHPHIGLATVTYLFEGAMMHRDSTGVVQRIETGAIPELHLPGATVRVLVGRAFGLVSPVRTLSPTLYVDLDLGATGHAAITVPEAADERALYGVDNGFALDGIAVPAHTMVVLEPGAEPVLTAPQGGRVVLIGGAPLGHRHMVWNFVSSRRERIAQAQDDWEAQSMGQVPGETEFIPLPPRRA